jgi:F-type H+-transporting ATPase subunit epsilon
MHEPHCIVVTPERTVRDEAVDFVALPLVDGEIGIAPGHTPMIGRLGAGELRLVHAGKLSRYYVERGFVEVLAGVVSVLTARAVPGEALDSTVAAEQLESARQQPARAPEEMAARDAQVARLRAQLRVARRASG